MAAVIASDVFQAESLGQVEVTLNGAELPLTTNCITHIDVNLWTVKRSVALLHGVLHTMAIQRFTQSSCCLVPNFVRAH